MKITRDYGATFFEQEAIRAAIDLVKLKHNKADSDQKFITLSIQSGSDDMDFECSEEGLEEFLSMYNLNVQWATLVFGSYDEIRFELRVTNIFGGANSKIGVNGNSKSQINELLRVFDVTEHRSEFVESEPKKPKPIVFLGHGRSNHWALLKSHLQDKHGIEVIAYETGARSGHTIRDILEEMSKTATMAFLLHTAEDEAADGKFSARPNVIHETGLFQGKLGFGRAIVVLEDGCEEYSNLAGIQQIRYSKGNIKEIFGDVLAVIKREFGVI